MLIQVRSVFEQFFGAAAEVEIGNNGLGLEHNPVVVCADVRNERLYENDPIPKQGHKDGVLPEGFIRSFQAEHGFAPDDAARGLHELIELAVEDGNLIAETTVGQIRRRLRANRGFSRTHCDAFLRAFGLFHRPDWETPPANCTKKDIYPWRFGRKLSVVFRPLLVFGDGENDKVLFGVSTLRLGFSLLIQKITQGHFSPEFFSSKEMKQYIGSIGDRLGKAFESEIAQRFRTDGWRVRQRGKMTSLGAPKNLGDIDVLAWNMDGRICVVECKRLQFARTVAEIAEVCQRFRGQAKDELAKHLERLRWIRTNPRCLEPIVGFCPSQGNVTHGIVTSTVVPMTYLNSLPIESEKIGVWEHLRRTSFRPSCNDSS